MNQSKELKRVVLASILAAIAVVLGIIVKYTPGLNLEFPNGGSVFGFYILPLTLIGLLLGYRYAILGGLVYGIVSWLLDGYFYHWGSIFLDYLIPFTLVAVSGAIFHKKGVQRIDYIIYAFLIGFALRWISHGLSGVLFFGEYAPEGTNPWFYSFILYNLPYTASSASISLVLALILRPTLKELTKGLNQ